jgi:hypothetical protein
MEPLPFIDVHTQKVHAPREAVWSALLAVLGRQLGGHERYARFLGCDPARSSGSLTGHAGETLPGFRVIEAEPARRLALGGQHRFARYELTFELRGNELSAQTHAAFPGLLGRLYRAAVISSGGHALITRHLLREVARATQGPPPTPSPLRS